MSKSNITDEVFIETCRNSITMREAYLKLNIPPTTFKRRAIKLGCYYTNQGGKGKKREKVDAVPLSDILQGNVPTYQTYKLKLRLIKAGIKEDKCERCGWNVKPQGALYTPCELHHIDGNPKNHRLDNLVILCPNCHSLTKTYRFRKRSD